MDGGAWLATVHGVAKCRTRLSDFTIRYVFRDFLFPESSLTPINWPGLPQQKPPFYSGEAAAVSSAGSGLGAPLQLFDEGMAPGWG